MHKRDLRSVASAVKHAFTEEGAAQAHAIEAANQPVVVISLEGMRMAGRMGGTQVTALNLQVVSSDPDRQLILVKGAVPGARGTVVVLRDSVKATTLRGGSR